MQHVSLSRLRLKQNKELQLWSKIIYKIGHADIAVGQVNNEHVQKHDSAHLEPLSAIQVIDDQIARLTGSWR